MSITKKITSLVFTAVAFASLLPYPAIAQELDDSASNNSQTTTNDDQTSQIEAMSAQKFLISIGRSDLAAKIEEGNKQAAVCGDINNICSSDQICLKCTRFSGEEEHVNGFCVSKNTDLSIFEEYRTFNRMMQTKSRTAKDRQKYREYHEYFKKLLNTDTIYTLCEQSSSFINYSGRSAYKNYHLTGDCGFVGGDNKNYCLVLLNGNTSVQYANESNDATRGCEVLPVKLYNYRKCFFCPLVGVIYDGSAKITDIAFSKMAAAFATLLAIGFAIWVALQVLTQVSSITKQDAPKFLGGLIKQSYKVIIAFILSQNSQQVFTYAVRPILEAGLVFGQNMLTTKAIFQGLDTDGKGNYIRQAKEVTGGNHYKLDTYDKLEQFVVAVQREIAFMQAVGTSLICTGSNLMLLNGKISEFGDGFQMFVQGIVLAIFGFLLSLAFAFYLIDAVVQFGVVGALLPFLIVSWPFKATAKYTSTGTQMLLNSAFLFLFVGLVISANMFLINEALNQTPDEQENQEFSLCQQEDYYATNKEKCENILKQTPRMGALFEIAQTLNSLDSTKLKELTDISAMGFLILLFCCVFGFKFTGQAIPLADKFASGGISKPIAPGIATMGASFAKSAASRATKNIREAAGDRIERGTKWVVGLIPRGIKASWRKMRGQNKKPASSGGSSNPQSTAGNPAPSSNSGGFENAQAAATLSEQTQASRNPTLSEQTQAQKSTPTLSEAQGSPKTNDHQSSSPQPSTPADENENNNREISPDDGNEPSNQGNSSNADEATAPHEKQSQQKIKQDPKTGQYARQQSQGRQKSQPRQPKEKMSQTRHNHASKGGSRHNRNKRSKRNKR